MTSRNQNSANCVDFVLFGCVCKRGLPPKWCLFINMRTMYNICSNKPIGGVESLMPAHLEKLPIKMPSWPVIASPAMTNPMHIK